MKKYLTKTHCRICGSARLSSILDLGRTPLANAFLSQDRVGKRVETYPLELMFCEECTLVKLHHVIDSEVLFGDTYHYFTSASAPLVAHFEGFAEEVRTKLLRSPDDLIVEIGSNDGTLLSYLKDDCRVLGVDPAPNMARHARKKGVPTRTVFFNLTSAQKIRRTHGAARGIIANNVFAHIDDIFAVLDGVTHLLDEDGTFIFEVNWATTMIEEGSFDQVYHEHMSYYSLHALVVLAQKSGFVLSRVAVYPMHGKTLRVSFTKKGKADASVARILRKEKALGIDQKDRYTRFAREVLQNGAALKDLLVSLKAEGATIAAYGAPAKGNTLLNVLGIDRSVIDYVVDSTPIKQGMYMPGSRIPIVHPDMLATQTPQYVLLLAWNYADAILSREKELRKAGVKFIVPVPTLRIV